MTKQNCVDVWPNAAIWMRDELRSKVRSRIGTGKCLFINLIRRALWLTLSNALERSIAQRLTMLPLETHWSTILRTVYIAVSYTHLTLPTNREV